MANRPVKDVGDLYRLNKRMLAALEGMGDKRAQNILDAIEGSKDNDLPMLVSGLSISKVGTSMAEILAEEFGSMDALKNASIERLKEVGGIGQIVAKGIYDYFRDEEHLKVLDKLANASVNMTKIY